jgi:hypothetical protein
LYQYICRQDVADREFAANHSPGRTSRDSVTRFFASGFFHESVSPQPQSIPLGPLQIFSKNCGDIRKSRCTTGINTGGKFATGVNDTSGKVAAGINDTRGKFASSVVDLVSLT